MLHPSDRAFTRHSCNILERTHVLHVDVSFIFVSLVFSISFFLLLLMDFIHETF